MSGRIRIPEGHTLSFTLVQADQTQEDLSVVAWEFRDSARGLHLASGGLDLQGECTFGSPVSVLQPPIADIIEGIQNLLRERYL